MGRAPASCARRAARGSLAGLCRGGGCRRVLAARPGCLSSRADCGCCGSPRPLRLAVTAATSPRAAPSSANSTAPRASAPAGSPRRRSPVSSSLGSGRRGSCSPGPFADRTVPGTPKPGKLAGCSLGRSQEEPGFGEPALISGSMLRNRRR